MNDPRNQPADFIRLAAFPKRSQVVRLVALLALLAPALALADEAKPNVVLIVADDLGWSDLGCYGSTFYRTPNLDRLASQGVRFTQNYAAGPVCSPTRAALLTGKHPARLEITDWIPGAAPNRSRKFTRPEFHQQLPLEETTLAESFKASGYATAHVGKWHLGGDGFEPTRQGFDINIGGNAHGTALSYFAPFARQGKIMPGLESAPDGQYLTERLTDEALHFIDEHKTSPFFLYFPHYNVHTPIVAKPEIVAQYPSWDGIPRGKQENPTYAAMVQSLDESVGRIMATLDRLDLTNQTIVIFTSDNGGLATQEGSLTPATINSPLREGKGWLYEGGIRVPMIFRWPGRIKTGVETTRIWSADLFPTLLALRGIAPSTPFDGIDISPVLTKGEPIPSRSLFWHYPHYSGQGGRPSGAVIDGEWKLVKDDTTERLELFHLADDIRESKNLSEAEPEKVKELAARLETWRKEISAKRIAPNHDYLPNEANAEGLTTLPARTANVHGITLRYEPLPHKNTLGYWIRTEDWASWEFDIRQAGDYDAEALVGCGNGSGGGKVAFVANGQTLTLLVPETGGFQAFQRQKLGKFHFQRAGRFELEVRPISKPGAAVMDLREVTIRPTEGPK